MKIITSDGEEDTELEEKLSEYLKTEPETVVCKLKFVPSSKGELLQVS